MKPHIAVFFSTALVVFVMQVLLDITIFQVTFGFAHESLVWQMISAALVALIVSAVATQARDTKPAAS
jgi:hypothetical protein